MSLPTRGAWIETALDEGAMPVVIRRSPLGGRGLKQVGHRSRARQSASLPTRGAWIETANPRRDKGCARVAPHSGGVD